MLKSLGIVRLIGWDEIVMCMRYNIEAVDRTIRAIIKVPDIPFDGKCILFSGDFRQILPVIPKGFSRNDSSSLFQVISFVQIDSQTSPYSEYAAGSSAL